MKYVIIGNSAGAIGCIEGIRRYDKTGHIVLIADEPYHTYSRPLISYLLLGETDEQRMKYRPDDFYQQNGVETILGVAVTKIDAADKKLTLDNGQTVKYDKLLTATGSIPFVPSTKGMEKVQNAFTFMTLDDAKALDKVLTPASRVLVVGAGLIGLKCAEGILHKVQSVTVVDLAEHVLSSILNEKGAAIMQAYLAEKGVNFIMGDCVAEFGKNTAKLKNSGQKLEFDALVMAVGVLPNTELLTNAGAAVDRGVLVDEHCQTTLPDVYAAGDCTQGYDLAAAKKRILALLPNAYLQGECAGANMAGTEKVFNTGLAMNSIGFWGKHVMTAGVYEGEALEETDGVNYKCLFIKNNRLVGFIIIGDVARAGIYTALIRNQKPLDEVDFDLIREHPQLMAFSRCDRAKMLAGAKEE